ncbi:colonization of soil protein [Pseudomonas fluorescens Pf0-1]|uniref:Colonization of soil protein n=1 Tax=Pseudomonas fluorescens (strain Pf0-1) TaxID=205922 RepID=C6UAS1_PSEPF|nr:colonization of soil protein [Pseudomonas fluorescens Pf0-1]
MVGMYTPWKAISRGMGKSFGLGDGVGSKGRLRVEQRGANEVQVAFHPPQRRGIEVRCKRLVSGGNPADRVIDRDQCTFQIARIRLQEQSHQRTPHDPDRLTPWLRFGIRRMHRQDRLFLAQLDDRVADFQHHEHPAQQVFLHQRLTGRQAISLMHQVAGTAFETRRQPLELAADGVHHLPAQVLLQALPQPAAVRRQNDRPRRRADQHAHDHGDVVVDEGVGVVDRQVVRHRTGAEKDQQAETDTGVLRPRGEERAEHDHRREHHAQQRKTVDPREDEKHLDEADQRSEERAAGHLERHAFWVRRRRRQAHGGGGDQGHGRAARPRGGDPVTAEHDQDE